MEESTSTSKNPQAILTDSVREIFRQHLRQADKYIIENNFPEAKTELAEAKKIDPNNPYIIAFEERIKFFENKGGEGNQKISSVQTPKPQAMQSVSHLQKDIQTGTRPSVVVSSEQKLRAQIENEYKIKFTQELHKAEQQASKILEAERAKLEHQRQILKLKYDQQLEDVQKQLEKQYRQKLDEEITNAENRLKQQHETELASVEKEMKNKLTQQYESDLKNLIDRSKREREELLIKEKKAFHEHEQLLKEQYEHKLNEVLQKNEAVSQVQNRKSLEIEQEQLKKILSSEYEIKLAENKKMLMQEFQKDKTSLEEDYQRKKYLLNAEIEKKVREKQDALIKIETEKYEQNRAVLRKELESDFQSKYEHQLDEERKRFQSEAGKKIETEKKRLEEEIVKAEKQLEDKYKAKLVEIETNTKERLTKQYQSELQNLQNRLKKEQDEILAKEHKASQKREQSLKDEFNKKLLGSIRKAESLYMEQAKQQIKIEQGKIEKQFRSEFQTKLAEEKETLKRQFDEAKASIEKTSNLKRSEINAAIENKVQEELKILRKNDEEKYERQRTNLRKELEAEFQKKYENQIAEERAAILKEADAKIEIEKKKLESEYEQMIQKQNDQLQKIRSDIRNEMETALLGRLERIAQEYDHKMDLLGAKIPESKEEKLNLYKKKLSACYTNGQPSVDEAKDLMQLKELLELSFDEHLNMESDVRLDQYSRYVEKKIHAGELKANNLEELNTLKQQFNITTEEATRLEPYILSCFMRLVTKGRILVVDDDLMLLKSLEDMLNDCGYQVITAPDINSALEELKNEVFDLILSDIKFGVGELDGFKFFKTVQAQEQLRSIPFIFMSSLQDGVIIRSGVELGVDDYITKPMDPDLIIATIEGKLKRFRSLRKD
jgi:CheY-like chemotaxis protein